MSGPGRGSFPPKVNLCISGAVLAATSVALGGVDWQDSCLLLEHEVERHGNDVIDRPVSGCGGDALGVEITKLSVVPGSDLDVATICVARPSGPRTLGNPFGELRNDAAGLPWGAFCNASCGLGCAASSASRARCNCCPYCCQYGIACANCATCLIFMSTGTSVFPRI